MEPHAEGLMKARVGFFVALQWVPCLVGGGQNSTYRKQLSSLITMRITSKDVVGRSPDEDTIDK